MCKRKKNESNTFLQLDPGRYWICPYDSSLQIITASFDLSMASRPVLQHAVHYAISSQVSLRSPAPKGISCPEADKGMVWPGYQLPMVGSGEIAVHHLVEAMKNAFALRSHLGDPGSDSQFLNLTSLLEDALSPDFADMLRYRGMSRVLFVLHVSPISSSDV